MGKYTKSENLRKEICTLLKMGPLGFNEILAELQELRKDQDKRSCSSETLAKALKELQVGKFVERDPQTRKYSLTDAGVMSTQPLSAFRVKARRDLKIPRGGDITEYMVNAYVRGLQTRAGKQTALPPSVVQQITDQVRQFANGKTLAIWKLRTDIIDYFTTELSSILSVFMSMHASYAPSVPREVIADTIRKAVALWFQFRLDLLQSTLSDYLSNPEVLADLDKAIRKHGFTANLVSTPFEQISIILKHQKQR